MTTEKSMTSISSVITTTENVFSSVFATTENVFSSVITTTENALSTAYNSTESALSSATASAGTLMTSVATSAAEILSSTEEKIISTMTTARDILSTAIETVTSSASAETTTSGMTSPSGEVSVGTTSASLIHIHQSELIWMIPMVLGMVFFFLGLIWMLYHMFRQCEICLTKCCYRNFGCCPTDGKHKGNYNTLKEDADTLYMKDVNSMKQFSTHSNVH